MSKLNIKKLDNYIYTNVIAPLKQLDMPTVTIENPEFEKNKTIFRITVSRERIHGDMRQYEREIAQREAKYIIRGEFDSYGFDVREKVLGKYDPTDHSVTVFSAPFETYSFGKLLMNRIVEAFQTNTPFNHVEIVERSPL